MAAFTRSAPVGVEALRAAALSTALQLVGVALASSSLFAAEIITYGTNSAEWNEQLGVTAIRLGCSGVPEACLASARHWSEDQSIDKVYLAVLLTSESSAQMREYADLLNETSLVAEIGFDDFVSEYLQLVSQSSERQATDILEATINTAMAANIEIGITLYEDELSSPWLRAPRLPEMIREKIDYVHLYLHYRENADRFSDYVEQTAALFPHAAIIAGVYAYDRIDYLSCRQGVMRRCSVADELRLFRRSFEIQIELLKLGRVHAMEFYPAAFGQEEGWGGWNNSSICNPSRRSQCLRNTRAMRGTALEIMNTALDAR